MELKFCVEVDVLKSAISLDLIEYVSDYDNLGEKELQAYFDKESAESRSTLTLSVLESIVWKEIIMDMENKDAR